MASMFQMFPDPECEWFNHWSLGRLRSWPLNRSCHDQTWAFPIPSLRSVICTHSQYFNSRISNSGTNAKFSTGQGWIGQELAAVTSWETSAGTFVRDSVSYLPALAIPRKLLGSTAHLWENRFPDHMGSKNESLLEQQPCSRGEVPPISWSALTCFFELPHLLAAHKISLSLLYPWSRKSRYSLIPTHTRFPTSVFIDVGTLCIWSYLNTTLIS